MEKGKALDFAKKLKDKAHAGDARIIVLEVRLGLVFFICADCIYVWMCMFVCCVSVCACVCVRSSDIMFKERENIPAEFWAPLGGPGPIPPASSVPEDREAEQAMRSVGILYLVGAENGSSG